MTVGTRLVSTYASLRAVAAGLRSQAADDSRRDAEKVLDQAARELEGIIRDLSRRMEQVQEEEPEYLHP